MGEHAGDDGECVGIGKADLANVSDIVPLRVGDGPRDAIKIDVDLACDRPRGGLILLVASGVQAPIHDKLKVFSELRIRANHAGRCYAKGKPRRTEDRG